VGRTEYGRRRYPRVQSADDWLKILITLIRTLYDLSFRTQPCSLNLDQEISIRGTRTLPGFGECNSLQVNI